MNARTVVITGGEGDLGRAIAEEYRKSGWQVYAPGRKELDVCSSESVQAYFAKLTTLDVLINNAGVCRDRLAARVEEEDWMEVQRVNLEGAWRCSVAAGEMMRKTEGGHIIQVGSYAGKVGGVGQVSYASAKAGLVGLSQSLAKEWGEFNIQINVVLPGFMDTKMSRDVSEEARERVLKEHVLKRWNTVEEAARFICFLGTLKNCSGQIFQLDSRVGR